jgi:hypothetical protein
MTKEEILSEIAALPPEAQRQVENLITVLKERYQDSPAVKTAPSSDIRSEPFVGMWRNREDLSDSAAWVRNVREKHWSN